MRVGGFAAVRNEARQNGVIHILDSLLRVQCGGQDEPRLAVSFVCLNAVIRDAEAQQSLAKAATGCWRRKRRRETAHATHSRMRIVRPPQENAS